MIDCVKAESLETPISTPYHNISYHNNTIHNNSNQINSYNNNSNHNTLYQNNLSNNNIDNNNKKIERKDFFEGYEELRELSRKIPIDKKKSVDLENPSNYTELQKYIIRYMESYCSKIGRDKITIEQLEELRNLAFGEVEKFRHLDKSNLVRFTIENGIDSKIEKIMLRQGESQLVGNTVVAVGV